MLCFWLAKQGWPWLPVFASQCPLPDLLWPSSTLPDPPPPPPVTLSHSNPRFYSLCHHQRLWPTVLPMGKQLLWELRDPVKSCILWLTLQLAFLWEGEGSWGRSKPSHWDNVPVCLLQCLSLLSLSFLDCQIIESQVPSSANIPSQTRRNRKIKDTC